MPRRRTYNQTRTPRAPAALASKMLGVPRHLLDRWSAATRGLADDDDEEMGGKMPAEAGLESGVISVNKRGRATMYIYGPVVDEEWRTVMRDWFDDRSFVSGIQIRGALDGFDGKALDVRMNCPGGFVDEASVIHAAISEEVAGGCKVSVLVDGIAASAATTIMLAGNSVRMARMAELFIHPAWTFMIGNRYEMRAEAKDLERIDAAAVRLYAERMGGDERAAAALMAANPDSVGGRGSWLSAAEAIKVGLADGYIAAADDDDEDDMDDEDDDMDADDMPDGEDDEMEDDDGEDDDAADDEDDEDDDEMPEMRRRARQKLSHRRAQAVSAFVRRNE